MYLLDSTHCIMIMSNKEAILQKIASLIDVPISTCSVVIGELFFGAYKSDQIQRNVQLIDLFFGRIYVYQPLVLVYRLNSAIDRGTKPFSYIFLFV